jgi:VWFA-related protein
MKPGYRSIGLALLLPLMFEAATLGGQQAGRSPQPPTLVQQDAAVNGASAPTYRIETHTQLVLIPALVTDRNGNHISGLKAGDFTVKDNGKIRTVKLLEEITAPPANLVEREKLPPGTYSNAVVRSKAPLRVVIILFDMLNSHFKDQVPARIQVTKYLNEQVEPGTLVALLGLGRGGLRMYHDLTSDTKGLATELETAMLSGRHAISTNLQGEMSETESEEAFVGHGAFAQTNSSGRSSKKLIVLDTLAAFKNIAGAYASIPGRKSLVWVTGGFPFTLDDSKPGKNGMAGMDKDSLLDILPDYQSTWQALNDANVALYPVDMHGLQDTEELDATYRSKKGGDAGSRRALAKAPMDKQNKNEDNIQTLTTFAGETGGKAFYNDNDLVAGFREAVADSRSSYLLGCYLDQNETPGWHKLHVEVTRSGVHIRARAGFMVAKPYEKLAAVKAATEEKDTPQAIDVNLAMRSPMNYTGIPITVKWVKVAEGRSPTGTGADAGKLMVPFQIILPPEAATLDADESTVSLNFVGLARSSRGEDAANFVKKIDGKLKPESAKRLVMAGIKFDSMMMLAPGYYNVRFVVRDNVSGRVGSVTAPVVVK